MSKEVLSDLSVKGTLSIPKTGGGEMNVRQEIEGKQATLSFDSTPTASSTNPVTSGGVKTALDAKQATITGGATTIVTSNLTVSRALASDASGKVGVSAVTSTELGYLSGVTSAIQTQLNAKQATITGGATTIATSNLTAGRALASDANGKVGVSAVTATELGYVSGVTSGIQTQLNGKQATLTFDNVPTPISPNPVSSGVIYNNLSIKADKSELTAGLALKIDKGGSITTGDRVITFTNVPGDTWRKCRDSYVTNFVTFICGHQNLNVYISPDTSEIIHVCQKSDTNNGDGWETFTFMVPTEWHYYVNYPSGTPNKVIEQPIFIN